MENLYGHEAGNADTAKEIPTGADDPSPTRWAHWLPLAYNFPTFLGIFIEEDGGNGTGSLIPAARVRSRGGNNIEIENFGIYPARLTNIKVGKK